MLSARNVPEVNVSPSLRGGVSAGLSPVDTPASAPPLALLSALEGMSLRGRCVLSVGIDLVHIPSFGEQLEGATAFSRMFTSRERRDAARTAHEVASLAARWAAKEALVKAWSSALYGTPPPVEDTPEVFACIEVVLDAFRRPALALRDPLASLLERDVPGAFPLVSLSHDGDYAQGCVVLTCPSPVVSV